jgi:hypothetical protein
MISPPNRFALANPEHFTNDELTRALTAVTAEISVGNRGGSEGFVYFGGEPIPDTRFGMSRISLSYVGVVQVADSIRPTEDLAPGSKQFGFVSGEAAAYGRLDDADRDTMQYMTVERRPALVVDTQAGQSPYDVTVPRPAILLTETGEDRDMAPVALTHATSIGARGVVQEVTFDTTATTNVHVFDQEDLEGLREQVAAYNESDSKQGDLTIRYPGCEAADDDAVPTVRIELTGTDDAIALHLPGVDGQEPIDGVCFGRPYLTYSSTLAPCGVEIAQVSEGMDRPSLVAAARVLGTFVRTATAIQNGLPNRVSY